MSGLQVNVADLLLPTGARRQVAVTSAVAGLQRDSCAVVAPLEVDVMLERVSRGVMVAGQVRGSWTGACSRCLGLVDGAFRAPLRELYARSRPGDPAGDDDLTYPVVGDLIDLELVVRDAVVFELPAAPLCRLDCRGLCPTCGADRNRVACACDTEPLDPRWAALADLEAPGAESAEA